MLSLYIGNKNYSSWSLRPWLLMRTLEIPFVEHRLSLFTDGFKSTLARYTPVARVPVLIDDDFSVWDSLAIVEYLAERFPDRGVWPKDFKARARARSICAEMHSGFGALRTQLPMNLEAHLPGKGWNKAVQKDVDRLVEMWRELLGAPGGPFLFGAFSAADAFFAPIVTRLQTYGIDLPADCQHYGAAIRALPAMQAWTREALTEHEYLAEDEPYRDAPADSVALSGDQNGGRR